MSEQAEQIEHRTEPSALVPEKTESEPVDFKSILEQVLVILETPGDDDHVKIVNAVKVGRA